MTKIETFSLDFAIQNRCIKALPTGATRPFSISSGSARGPPPQASSAGRWRPRQLRRPLREEEGYVEEQGALVGERGRDLSEMGMTCGVCLYVGELTVVFLRSHGYSTEQFSAAVFPQLTAHGSLFFFHSYRSTKHILNHEATFAVVPKSVENLLSTQTNSCSRPIDLTFGLSSSL